MPSKDIPELSKIDITFMLKKHMVVDGGHIHFAEFGASILFCEHENKGRAPLYYYIR